MMQRGQELIDRYKKNYNIPADAEITEEMILAHWELERRLTHELLESLPEDRWQVFERCYTELYNELEWLNRLAGTTITSPPSKSFKNWDCLIGQPPKDIYEIGSGKGKMIAHLASRGFKCKATEITHERGQDYVSEYPNLSWGISDGVHLERFEVPDSYDVVISNQVIEHLHPEDLCSHFKGVRAILRIRGKYIFATPHRYSGPSDISRVFNCNKPMGMHLKEYTYHELKELLMQAGFKDVKAVFRVPIKIGNFFRLWVKPYASHAYLIYLCLIEELISLLPYQGLRRKASRVLMVILFCPDILMIAKK